MAYTTINKPSDYFNTKLYTGNQTANTAITGVGFQPDWTWIKRREINWHCLVDAVRGATKRISSNETNTEVTDATAVTSLDSDGFTIGIDSNGYTNQNGGTYASWNWKANGAGSSNTDGSITSTVSANTTSGFSIVSYTGTGSNATVGHGLGSVPKMMIIKNRTNTQGWATYHHNQGAGNYIDLSSDNSGQAGSSIFNNTTPTSSVFSVATSGWTNDSGYNYIAYCFADVTGYSKFGSYIGNGNADGTFIYTGFKPAWFMVKQTNAAGNSWHILDNKRDSFNVMEKNLRANLSNAEFDTGVDFDFLSNGVKMRNTDGASNNFGGSTYIYMAFAEEPLVGDNPCTAR